MEKQKGISGFSETKSRLEQISEKKGLADEQKERTLEEISKIVSNIEQQLKQKKAKLHPQIKELRDLRKIFDVKCLCRLWSKNTPKKREIMIQSPPKPPRTYN